MDPINQNLEQCHPEKRTHDAKVLPNPLESADKKRCVAQQKSAVTNESMAKNRNIEELDRSDEGVTGLFQSSPDGSTSKEGRTRHLHTVTKAIRSIMTLRRNSNELDINSKLVNRLTPIGQAAYRALQKRHGRHKQESWNLTESKMIGNLWNTPRDAFSTLALKPGEYPCPLDGRVSCPSQLHDDWFPQQLGGLISRTTRWCDILSLSPPDGRFLEEFQNSILALSQKKVDRPIILRLLFGNIVGSPIDCNSFIRELTRVLPNDAAGCLQLWVGSWRKGVSWNHSKIIAVDGKYLWTGGHKYVTNSFHYMK